MVFALLKSNTNVDKASQLVMSSGKKYFDMCMSLFYDEAAEVAMRQTLVAWFKSGQMNKIVFHQMQSLQNGDISPNQFKSIDWRTLADDNFYSKDLQRISNTITADTFLQKQELEQLLTMFAFEKVNFKLSQDSHTRNVLVVSGRIIFLSDIIVEVEKLLKQNTNISEVRIYATNVLGIDTNLENEKWHGKNMVIIADKVHLWGAHYIDLSGFGDDANAIQSRADHGQIYGEDGKNGEDGRAGESSGNLVLLTEELQGEDRLTLKLNGGNGEHGEHGGNGANGKDGCGVTKNDLTSLILSYNTLYWGSSDHFFNFHPKDTDELSRQVDKYNKYVKATFKDSNGRLVHWSYAEDYSFWSTSTYDLYFVIKGSEGTPGGVGGLNGVGGEGGNRGECTVRTLYSGKELKISNIQRNPGSRGKHGSLGKAGHFGKNGNDMALVDRSTFSCGKKFIGESQTMSINFAYRMDSVDARFDGYEKWFKDLPAHYVRFTLTEIPDGQVMEMQSECKTDADRQSQSKTTTKASIILNNVVSEFGENYKKDETAIVKICQAQQQANQEENQEENEKNEETVAEEITVLIDSVDEDSSFLKDCRSKNSQLTWKKFIKLLHSCHDDDTDGCIELGLQLFQHEASDQELEQVESKIKKLIYNLKNISKKFNDKVSRFSVAQLEQLTNGIDQRFDQKKFQTKLCSQKNDLFDNYLSTADTIDRTMDKSSTTLVGVSPDEQYRGG